MIDANFFSALAPEKPKRRRARANLVDNHRTAAPKIRRWWSNWRLAKAHIDRDGKLIGVYEGVNVWKAAQGVYVVEKDLYFKATSSLEHAQVLAGDIAAGRNLHRINVKPTWEEG